jgi:SAM-dependent methyltransferase
MTPPALAVERAKQAGREFWDANPCGGQWRSYAEFLEWYRRTEPYMFDVVDEYDWRGMRVLEVGCGQGPLLNHLPSRGAHMVGIDMSVASLRRSAAGAVELGWDARVRVTQADAERLPFAAGVFDAVVSFGVLHHTPDTAGSIRELRRVLRPGGRAVVMLYRSGTPKWFATRLLRGIGRLIDRRGSKEALVDRTRSAHPVDDARGTALLELFGVPTLKAYSNREVRRMFDGFENVRVRNYQPGFRRLGDIAGTLRGLLPLLAAIDRVMQQPWGFYQVVYAERRLNDSTV